MVTGKLNSHKELSMSDSSLNDITMSAGPWRRLAAMVYDALLCLAIAFATVVILMMITFPLFPDAREHMLVASEIGWLAYLYRVGAGAAVALFIGSCWTRKGQTLGMQVWRIRVQTLQGGMPTWRDSLTRMGLALVPWLIPIEVLALSEARASIPLRWIGIGLLALPILNYAAAWFDPQLRSWHDRFLRTRVVRT